MFHDVDVHVEKTLTLCTLDNESIFMLLRLWQCWDSFFSLFLFLLLILFATVLNTGEI